MLQWDVVLGARDRCGCEGKGAGGRGPAARSPRCWSLAGDGRPGWAIPPPQAAQRDGSAWEAGFSRVVQAARGAGVFPAPHGCPEADESGSQGWV